MALYIFTLILGGGEAKISVSKLITPSDPT